VLFTEEKNPRPYFLSLFLHYPQSLLLFLLLSWLVVSPAKRNLYRSFLVVLPLKIAGM